MAKNKTCKKSDGKRMGSADRALAVAKSRANRIAKLQRIVAANPRDIAADTALKTLLLEQAGRWPSRKR